MASTLDVNRRLADRLLGHNAWATRALLDECRALTPRRFAQTFDIGPGSLHDTMLHIVGAMLRWADRIDGRPLRDPVEDGRTCTPAEIDDLLERAAADIGEVVQRVLEQDRLDEPMEFFLRGRREPYVFTKGTAIVHVVTHGVHHRAQALNMLRQLGRTDLPDVDAITPEVDGA